MYVIPIDPRGSPNTWHARIGRVKVKALETRISWGGTTRLDQSPLVILAYAMEAGLTHVVLAGWTEDGDEYFASSAGDGGTALWLFERAKSALLSHGDAADSKPNPKGAA